MKIKNHALSLFIITSICLSTLSCKNDQYQTIEEKAQAIDMSVEEIIVKGKYLVGIMGCNDCHSPKKMGGNGPEIIPELLLSGYPSSRPIVTFDSKLIKEGCSMFYPDLTAAKGPWGITFAGNLTPDGTGIGNWTEAQFKKALTQGKFKGLDNGRLLLPPMPWFNYAEMNDEDVHAVFTYLKSIQPVENVVPSPIGPDN